ncbi:MAG: hypothetical protein ACREJP_00845 [Candidatus Methylomirabilales bacterium]
MQLAYAVAEITALNRGLVKLRSRQGEPGLPKSRIFGMLEFE